MEELHEISAAVKQFIVAEFIPGSSTDELEDDYDLLANGVIDSLGLLKLIEWLQERFQISIEDTDVAPENLSSVTFISTFVEKIVSADTTGARSR